MSFTTIFCLLSIFFIFIIFLGSIIFSLFIIFIIFVNSFGSGSGLFCVFGINVLALFNMLIGVLVIISGRCMWK
ncbi:unnamed protein product [Meloidogyne enterolobii]|uniref:Uncharacterized protein n=1 Tax=Meloidogyne enterolobii TaxID=390850 RepID=A0ACB1AW21_MELEN